MTTATKFTHAGLDWLPHMPGDPMPCPPDTTVRIICRSLTDEKAGYHAHHYYWGTFQHEKGAEIIGWHPIEERPSLDRRVLDLLESGDIEQAKQELRKELE